MIRKSGINWAILAIVLAGLMLRLHQLARHDFWADEVLTIEIASGVYSGQGQAFYHSAVEKNPPFYYALIRQWLHLFGPGEFSLRFFSVLFSVLAVFFIYKLGVLFFDKVIALIAAGLIAFSPFQVWYAQEARMFSLAVFLSCISLYFFFKALQEENRINWAGYFISSLGLIFTVYYAFLLFIPQLAIVLCAYRKSFLRWFFSAGLAVLIFVFSALPRFITQFRDLQSNFWVPHFSSPQVIPASLSYFILGYNAGKIAYWLVIFVLGVLFFSALLKKKKQRAEIFFLLLFIVPVCTVFLLAKFIAPVYLNRQLIIFSPFLYLFLASGIVALKQTWLRLGVLAVFVILLANALFSYYADKPVDGNQAELVFLKKPVQPLVKLFLSQRGDANAIGFANLGLAITFKHYLWEEGKDFTRLKRFYFYEKGGDPYLEKYLPKMEREDFIAAGHYNVDINSVDLKKYGITDIWVFFTSWQRDGSLSPNDSAVKAWFDQHYPRLKEFYLDGVKVVVYQLR